MPELPEVQTTVDGLNQKVKGKKIIDVWTDIAVDVPTLTHFNTTTKNKSFFKSFKSLVVGTTIKSAERRGKNILIHLSKKPGQELQTIWIHMKMTGHMMYGEYAFDAKINPPAGGWSPDKNEKNEALRDPFNKFLHTVFTFSNNKQLVLSDMRKFGKVTIIPTSKISEALSNLGPEPLSYSFTQEICKERLMLRPKMPIKLALLDQTLIVGIGNIYSDEALWLSGIHPMRIVSHIKNAEMKKLHAAILTVLKKGIYFGGDSMSDYRNIDGERGDFQNRHEAYRRTGKACRKKGCRGIIARLPFGGRSAHFCPVHQK